MTALVDEGVVVVLIATVRGDGGFVTTGSGSTLPCHSEDADLWFAERPAQLDRAQRLCRGCPIRRECLETALDRREPWGVWGGEIFDRGRVIPFKRGRGRPAKRRPDEHEQERTSA
jgi:WhiB family redox-sensing transcriptional regulator